MPWSQLKAILDENRKSAAEEKREPVTVCPLDGALLEFNPKTGISNCPMGNYTVRGGPRGL